MDYREAMALILRLAKADANRMGGDAARYTVMGYLVDAAKCRAEEKKMREAIAVVEAEMMTTT